MATYTDQFITVFRETGSGHVTGAFGRVSGAATAATAAIAGIASVAGTVTALGIAAIKTASQYEMLGRRLEGVFRGAGKEAMAFAKEMSRLTPYELPQIVDLMARMQAMGLDTFRDMPTILDASAGLGSVESGEGISRALGQMRAKGRVQLEELYQIAERGVDVFGILSKELGVSKDRLFEMTRTGLAAEPVVNAILNSLDAQYSGAAANSMNTLSGALSNFRESWAGFLAAVGTPVLPYLTEQVKSLTGQVDGLDGAMIGMRGFAYVIAFGEKVAATFKIIANSISFVINTSRAMLSAVLGGLSGIVEGLFTTINGLIALAGRLPGGKIGLKGLGIEGPLDGGDYWKNQRWGFQKDFDEWMGAAKQAGSGAIGGVTGWMDNPFSDRVNQIMGDMAKARPKTTPTPKRTPRPVDLSALQAAADTSKATAAGSGLQRLIETVIGGGRLAASGVKATEVGRLMPAAGQGRVQVDVSAGNTELTKGVKAITSDAIEQFTRWLFGTPQGKQFARQQLGL